MLHDVYIMLCHVMLCYVTLYSLARADSVSATLAICIVPSGALEPVTFALQTPAMP